MHLVPTEIPIPKNEADFERMCANVYGVVFDDPSPKINGRKGQAQGGVDIFVNAKGIGRIGIQCKKYFLTKLKLEHVVDEVGKADKHKIPIKRLLIATTSQSDATLLHDVQLLSDIREGTGQFTVEVEFWEDIENRIGSFPVLQDSYAPHSPGAAYYRQEKVLERVQELAIGHGNMLASVAAIPLAREDSANKIVTAQLDRTNELFKAGHYKDAFAHVSAIGKDLGLFDTHQKARWYLQRGLCLWFSRDDVKEAAAMFLKAAELYPDDERMAAAGIRGLMLTDSLDAAVDAGRLAVERFPTSLQVWLIYTNARMMRGDTVDIGALPSSMREESDTLQIFALAARQRGDFAEALRLAERAASYPEAGFFNRATALSLVVEDAARSPVAAMYGCLPQAKLNQLGQVAAMFEPRSEKLWSVQSAAVEETAAHLGFAFLMRRDNDGALQLVQEAAAHGIKTKDLLRVQVQALSEVKRHDELLALGRARLADLTPEAIIVVAEVAANRKDVKFLEETIAHARNWSPGHPESVEILSALRWTALTRTGETDLAIKEIADANITASSSFILTSSAARLLIAAERPLEAAELIERAKSLVGDNSPESDRLMLAELLFYAERWTEAAALYAPLVPQGQISELHARLLACYVEADSRKKAKELLAEFPEGWVDDDNIRQSAITLGQKAGDWAFLVPLADAQVRRMPGRAVSWLFRLHVVLHAAPAALQDMVREVPEELSGSIRNITQLSALELRYDEQARGLRRLYRMVRQNFDEPEAFSAYFISVLSGSSNLPLMEEALPTVIVGSSVSLVDEAGAELQVAIDPHDVGALPKKSGFIPPDSPEALALLGVSIGQTVRIAESTLGGLRNYTVKAIQSAYRRLIHIAQERAVGFGGLPHMKAVSVGKSGDAATDFAAMHREIARSNAIAQQLFDAYGAGGLTLAGFAAIQGKSTVDVAAGWPSDAPPIFVDFGLPQHRAEAVAALARTDASYVTDSLTLTEFVNFGVPDALAALPKIYISPVTQQILEDYLDVAKSDQSVGVAVDLGDKLGFIEHDDAFRKRRIEFANELVGLAAKYCNVLPAYGELNPRTGAEQLVDLLRDEEREMLLLAKEHNATLLTLDGRLRLLAKECVDVSGVWPQPLIIHCLVGGHIAPEKCSDFIINEFLANRKFVSLKDEDLAWMVLQGDGYLQRGIQAFKRQLESADTEFESSISVALTFLSRVAQSRTQMGAFGEIFVHVAEAIFRRNDCPNNFDDALKRFVDDLVETLAGIPHIYAPVNQVRTHRMKIQRRYLFERIAEAQNRANNPLETRPIAVRVVYGTRTPFLVADKSISPPAPEKLAPDKVD